MFYMFMGIKCPHEDKISEYYLAFIKEIKKYFF